MKKALSALALAAAFAAGSAQAADLPSRKGPPAYVPPPPMITWTGFYGGLNLGGGWQENNNWNNWWGAGWGWNFNGGSNAGVVGGGQIGYNYQVTPMFVVGAEADFQGTTMGSTNNNNWWWLGAGWNAAAPRIDWYGTVTGRAGITLSAWPSLLIYGKGGFAYGDVRQAWGSSTQTGWTVGGGVEWMFMPNWSAKLEYGYHELSGGNNANNWWWGGPFAWNNWNNRTRFHVVRAGVNYHFNWGSPAPVLASY